MSNPAEKLIQHFLQQDIEDNKKDELTIDTNNSTESEIYDKYSAAVFHSNPAYCGASNHPKPFTRKATEEIPDLWQEIAPDLQGTLGPTRVCKLVKNSSGRFEMVQLSPREGNNQSGTSLPTYSCSVRDDEEDDVPGLSPTGLVGDSSEHETHKRPSSCGADLDIPSKRPRSPIQKRPVPRQGDGLPRPDHVRFFSERSHGDSGGYYQDCRGHSGIAERATIPNPAAIRHAILLDVHGTRWIPISIRYGTERHREDTLGNSPISILPVGVTHGHFKAIHAQPARGHCLRRYELPATYTAGSHTFTRLGDAENHQREIWQCDYSREDPEDLHKQQILPRLHASMQPRGIQRTGSTRDYHTSDITALPQIWEQWGYPGRERANHGRINTLY